MESLKVRFMQSHKLLRYMSQRSEHTKHRVQQLQHQLLPSQCCSMAGTAALYEVHSTAQFAGIQSTDDKGPWGATAGSPSVALGDPLLPRKWSWECNPRELSRLQVKESSGLWWMWRRVQGARIREVMGKLVFTLKAIGSYQVLSVHLSFTVIYTYSLQSCAFYKVHWSPLSRQKTDSFQNSPL